MHIVVEENMPFAPEAFGTLGEVRVLQGRHITKDDLKDVEILAVRSTTKIKPELIEGTPVKYVTTSTIGMDHMDIPYLEEKGIRYTNAPGCNADSVADYVTAALLELARRKDITLEGKTLGVVGCGNVGSRVVKRGQALGMTVLENDPPLARETGDDRYVPLDALADADFVTLHTPLTQDGPDKTFHLIDQMFIGRMKETAFLMNAGRGEVIATDGLAAALRGGWIAGAALDVWPGEPLIETDLVPLIDLASPHIAGHSFDGKVNGTVQVYEKVCEWLGIEKTWNAESVLPEPDVPELTIDAAGRADEEVLREAVEAVYQVMVDDTNLRETITIENDTERAKAFDKLRKQYRMRREFSRTRITLKNASDKLQQKMLGLTFQ